MILLDTSVWVDHLRKGDALAVQLLESGLALTHVFVIGELACGNLKPRKEIIELLQGLPQAPLATDQETLSFIERHKLMGQGIGYIDAHLLAATALHGMARLWTRDKKLELAANKLKLAYQEPAR